MNIRVIGLAAIAVMMTAILLQMNPSDSEAPAQTEQVFPTLETSLDDVIGIHIASGEQSISLSKTESGWLVSSIDDYPADANTVSQLLLDLSELEIAERKTSRQEYHERLGLGDNGIELTLEPLEQTIVFGNVGPSNGRFIRRKGEDQTFLTRQTLEVSADSMEWVDSLLLNVPEDQVQSVRIARQDGKLLQADLQDQQWQVLGLPNDRELRYPTIVESLGRILLNVRILDVAAYDPELFTNSNHLSVTTKEGEVIDLYSVQDKDDYWLHTSYNNRGGWQHKISEFTYNELSKEMEDLLMQEEETES